MSTFTSSFRSWRGGRSGGWGHSVELRLGLGVPGEVCFTLKVWDRHCGHACRRGVSGVGRSCRHLTHRGELKDLLTPSLEVYSSFPKNEKKNYQNRFVGNIHDFVGNIQTVKGLRDTFHDTPVPWSTIVQKPPFPRGLRVTRFHS